MRNHSSSWYTRIILIVLILVAVVLCVFLIQQYQVRKRLGIISTEHMHFADMVHRRSLNTPSAIFIEPWMTFAYISTSFHIPISYLTTTLHIATTTRGYPNVTLGRYARMIATSSTMLTQQVQEVVKNYISTAR